MELENGISVLEAAKAISEGLARAACAGKVNGKVVDLRTELQEDCTLEILTFKDEEGKKAFRHTASHVMAQAVKRLYPDTKLAIGPSIDDGFYYDFDRETAFSQEELADIEKEMKKIVKENIKLERFTLPREEAIQFMKEKEEPYKVELIQDLPEDAEISFYQQGDFTDLCAGPHLMSTKPIKAFKLISSSMAYWRGDSNKAKLQRIYATAYDNKEDLAAHMEHLEDNLRSFCPLKPLTEEENRFLYATANLILQFPTIPCNNCNYCMPCPYGINIPAALLYYNKCVNEGNIPESSQSADYRRARRAFLVGYDRALPAVRQANHCIGCGECVGHCPQRIQIPEELQRIDQLVEQLKQETL